MLFDNYFQTVETVAESTFLCYDPMAEAIG